MALVVISAVVLSGHAARAEHSDDSYQLYFYVDKSNSQVSSEGESYAFGNAEKLEAAIKEDKDLIARCNREMYEFADIVVEAGTGNGQLNENITRLGCVYEDIAKKIDAISDDDDKQHVFFIVSDFVDSGDDGYIVQCDFDSFNRSTDVFRDLVKKFNGRNKSKLTLIISVLAPKSFSGAAIQPCVKYLQDKFKSEYSGHQKEYKNIKQVKKIVQEVRRFVLLERLKLIPSISKKDIVKIRILNDNNWPINAKINVCDKLYYGEGNNYKGLIEYKSSVTVNGKDYRDINIKVNKDGNVDRVKEFGVYADIVTNSTVLHRYQKNKLSSNIIKFKFPSAKFDLFFENGFITRFRWKHNYAAAVLPIHSDNYIACATVEDDPFKIFISDADINHMFILQRDKKQNGIPEYMRLLIPTHEAYKSLQNADMTLVRSNVEWDRIKFNDLDGIDDLLIEIDLYTYGFIAVWVLLVLLFIARVSPANSIALICSTVPILFVLLEVIFNTSGPFSYKYFWWTEIVLLFILCVALFYRVSIIRWSQKVRVAHGQVHTDRWWHPVLFSVLFVGLLFWYGYRAYGVFSKVYVNDCYDVEVPYSATK
ncbi:hypothetical protein FMR86_15570 [Desulfovibrio sp. JC010]|nr:hypothetical protein [Desulfovibrio sp. JC010]